MKIVKCDICGKMEEGRKPEGFHEVCRYDKSLYNPDGYMDLCEDCYEEYDKIADSALRLQRNMVKEWFASKNKILKGENE